MATQIPTQKPRKPDHDPDLPPPAFADAFGRLARRTTLPGGRLEPSTIRDYWTALRDLPLEGLTEAADDLARRRVFFPAVAEWRHAVRVRPIDRECPRCHAKGLIKISYHSGDLFDVAICACVVGRVYRLAGDRLIRLRLGLQVSQQVAFIEDVLAAQDEAE